MSPFPASIRWLGMRAGLPPQHVADLVADATDAAAAPTSVPRWGRAREVVAAVGMCLAIRSFRATDGSPMRTVRQGFGLGGSLAALVGLPLAAAVAVEASGPALVLAFAGPIAVRLLRAPTPWRHAWLALSLIGVAVMGPAAGAPTLLLALALVAHVSVAVGATDEPAGTDRTRPATWLATAVAVAALGAVVGSEGATVGASVGAVLVPAALLVVGRFDGRAAVAAAVMVLARFGTIDRADLDAVRHSVLSDDAVVVLVRVTAMLAFVGLATVVARSAVRHTTRT